jgi:hypothetical protein
MVSYCPVCQRNTHFENDKTIVSATQAAGPNNEQVTCDLLVVICQGCGSLFVDEYKPINRSDIL